MQPFYRKEVGVMEKRQKDLELFGGKGAAVAAGYGSFPGFRDAVLRYPIPDQGYRYNGKPVWTQEHLLAWRASVPMPGGHVKKS